MTDATQLPVYIQARYRENGVFAEMESDFKSATSRMTDGAKREFGELDRFIKQAVASGGKKTVEIANRVIVTWVSEYRSYA